MAKAPGAVETITACVWRTVIAGSSRRSVQVAGLCEEVHVRGHSFVEIVFWLFLLAATHTFVVRYVARIEGLEHLTGHVG